MPKTGLRPIGGELVAAAVGRRTGNEEAADARGCSPCWQPGSRPPGPSPGPHVAPIPRPGRVRRGPRAATADPDRPGHERAWKVAVPGRASSPVIAEDRLFLTGYEAAPTAALAYRRADGAELWWKEAPAGEIEPFEKTEGSPAASTPATDGERLVVYFAPTDWSATTSPGRSCGSTHCAPG